jgi:predicted Zn-dependent protease
MQMTRRDFIWVSAATSGAVVTGCATNPATGERQLMFMSEAEEIALDRKWAPHQFSSDYGAVQDAELNGYLAEVGGGMAKLTHRKHMPYSFRAVNSVAVNGYTMPAGSIALARGLLIEMEDEAEFAAVLGHELGHVNARHAGERMSKQMLTSLFVAGLAAYVGTQWEEYSELAAGLGGVGAGLLLARYSRDDEREADSLGMEYVVRSGLNPGGMVSLQDKFRKLRKRKPGAVDLLFSTHPMNDERYHTAMALARGKYGHAAGLDRNRERFMDRTSTLRKMAGAIEEMQKGEKAMRMKKHGEAESHFRSALDKAPDDYAGLLMTAKCLLSQDRGEEARKFVDRAKTVYPGEPQADHISGMLNMRARRFTQSLADFESYERRLPGNSNTVFYKGFCYEGMGRKREAAAQYAQYARAQPSGEFAPYARERLAVWVQPGGYR